MKTSRLAVITIVLVVKPGVIVIAIPGSERIQLFIIQHHKDKE